MLIRANGILNLFQLFRQKISKTPQTWEFVCKKCNVKGKVRVDIVWFGEQPKYLDKIYKYLDRTDVFLSIGTSNNVYPAAGFIDYLKHQERKIDFYEFNIEKTSKSFLFTKSFIGPASETLKKFCGKPCVPVGTLEIWRGGIRPPPYILSVPAGIPHFDGSLTLLRACTEYACACRHAPF